LTITRRRLLRYAGALVAPPVLCAQPTAALNPIFLAKFVDPLPIPATARSKELRAVPGKAGQMAPYYRIAMREIEAKLHRDLSPARLWTYGGIWPGPTFEAHRGQEMLIEWANELPVRHFLPIDHRLHGAEIDKPEVRTVVHIHGAKVPPASDGYPEDWYTRGKSVTYHYPNDQEAAMLWYHDHAMGINRLNVYAGLAGVFIVRDAVEDALNLPKGSHEIPLVICDRFLRKDGQLDYPASGTADAPWVPEVFGDIMLVNGKAFPYLEVEPRKYRFRVLNASNGRFYNLGLSNGQEFQQIGTDQGLLPAPVPIKTLILAPGERADLVIDFREHAGEQIVLNNESIVILQFRVAKQKVIDSSSLPSVLRPLSRIAEASAVKTRPLTIDEFKNGPGETTLMLLNNSPWHHPVTEKPVLNTVEIWSIINPTDDSHPIHLHLVRFQILDRRPYDAFSYSTTGELKYTAPAVPPDPYEAGWKDTVQAHPGMVTRIIIRFEGYVGRYVWHCHVLEHEDNEMMRPYEIVAS
jgi:spore coat protein A, manganese oxidase